MLSSIYNGRYVIKPSKSRGYDTFYKSFRYKVSLFHCWVSNYDRAQEMTSDLNIKLLDETISGRIEFKESLEKTAQLIRANRKNGRTRKVVVRYALASEAV
jgi:hypothetical protein